MTFLTFLENTGVAIWVRESTSLFAYPLMIFLHALGLSFVVGLSVAIDLRLLGCASGLALTPLQRLYPLMWAAFWVNAISGAALLLAAAATFLVHPLFYIKMAFVVAAAINMALIRRQVFGDKSANPVQVPPVAKILAITSLILWLGAITVGRLTAYFGPGSMS